MHAFVRECIPQCVHACMHACMHTYMYTFIHTCIHACIHACVHAYIHTYSYTNHFITYILTFGPLTRFRVRRLGRAGWDMTFRTRFGAPVREVCSNLRFGTPPDASLLVAPPHIDSATLDERAEVFDAVAAESVQTGGFVGAAAEKHDASEGQNSPGPSGSEASKSLVFFVVFVQAT